jgi:3'-5' exoribonuclease
MRIEGFPQNLAMLLKHMVLSHHGQYDFGSPKRPKTIEATVLNYLDDLDSKINGIQTHMGKELDSSSRWTAYHRLYDRYYFRENCLDGEDLTPTAEPEPEQPAAAQPSEPGPAQPTARVASPERREQRPVFQNNPFAALKEKI